MKRKLPPSSEPVIDQALLDEAKRAIAEDPLAVPQAEGIGQARLPFGPFLILGILEFLLAGDQIASWYEQLLVR